MKKYYEKIFGFIIILLMVISIFSINISAAETIISFGNKNLTVGDTFTVTITMNAGEKMYSAGCVINYDNNIINYISGNASGGAGSVQIVESPSGETKVSYTLTFKAVAVGSTPVSVIDCKYVTLGTNGVVTKDISGTSETLVVNAYDEMIVSNESCGENTYWSLTKCGTLKLSGNGETYGFGTAEEVPWYKYAEQITKIEIEEEISYIGHYNFNCLKNIKEVVVYNPNLRFSPYYVFNDETKVVIYGISGSDVENYAKINNIEFIPIGVIIPSTPTVYEVSGNTVTLQETIGYEYSKDGIIWQESNVFNNIPFDTIQCFYQRVSTTNTDVGSPTSEALKCIIVSSPQIMVGATSLKFFPIAGYRYSVNGIKYQTDNLFTELVPEWNYTVYQEPINTDGIYVYKENNKAVFCTDGLDNIDNPNATHLVWLRKLLLDDFSNNLAADFNQDCIIDLRDLVNLKKKAVEL